MARCDRELKAGRPAPRGTAADVLTEQERTVAAFVATGRSIYTKLGVRSRAELAARSLRPADDG